jgi:uncharacterized protein YqeY
MVKSRQESATIYAEAGRKELADQESAEIKVINEFLPKQMDEAAVIAAAKSAIASTGATSVKDMGKVVNALNSPVTMSLFDQTASGATMMTSIAVSPPMTEMAIACV